MARHARRDRRRARLQAGMGGAPVSDQVRRLAALRSGAGPARAIHRGQALGAVADDRLRQREAVRMKQKRATRERYVRLTYDLMQTQAWRSLDGNARAIYIELAMLYRGVGSNNGQIGFSAR